jgi:hypothetical protein
MPVKKQFNILPVKSAEDVSYNVNDLPMVFPSFTVICGSSASGKSNLVLNLLFHWGKTNNKYPSFWRRIYYIGSSCNVDKTLKPLRDIRDNEAMQDDIEIITIDEDLDKLDIILKEIENHLNSDDIREYDAENKIHSICVFDDMGSYVRRGYNDQLAKLCSKYRHIGKFGLSCVFTSQTFRQTPTFLRKNASYYIIFRTPNKKDKDAIIEEFSSSFGDDIFIKSFDTATNAKYNFLMIDMRSMRLFHGMNTLLYERE